MPTPESFYKGLVEPGDTCYDVGANVGVHTAAMVEAGGVVLALEPQRNLHEQIIERVARAKIKSGSSGALIVPYAVGGVDGLLQIATSSRHPHLASASTAWRHVSPDQDVWDGTIEAPMVTLAGLISQHGVPRVLKIDTEGYEYEVLSTLDVAVDRVLFEVHRWMPGLARRCMEHLLGLGDYEFHVMNEESWKFTTTKPLRPEEVMENLPRWGDVYARRVRS